MKEIRNIAILLLGCLLVFSCLQNPKILLVREGQSDYVIVISDNASPSEKYAAKELQKTIEKTSDNKMPIVSVTNAPNTKRIFIGQSSLTDSLLSKTYTDNMSGEEFFIRTVGRDLLIVGGRKRGTMYGVFTFLEDYLGCRWYTADVIKIPQKTTLSIPSINVRQKPAFEYRMPFYTEAFDRTWATHNKVNGYGADLPPEVGGKVKYAKGYFGHTFYTLVPPEKYFKKHPEYFSLVRGKRVKDRGQLCLTNPDVLKIAIREIEEWLCEDPDANIISITQNDWEDWCECDSCKALDEREGSHSAAVVAFVNAIADSLGEKYPDKYFDTFAYTYTQKPPESLKVGDNVIIRLCHMQPSCDSHPLQECERNAKYVKHLREWRKKGGKLYVWHYVTDFSHYLMPFPNFNAIRKDIPFYYREGVSGIFCQGDAANGGGGEWAELRSYVLAKLLWNPNIDVDAVIDDFMQGVYGKAAPPIRRYFDMLHKIVRNPEMHFNLFSEPDEVGYLTPKLLKKSHAYFAKAEKLVAGDSVKFAKVKLAHLPVYYADLWFQAQRQINNNQPVDQAMVDTFKQIVAENGIEYHSEQANVEAFLKTLSPEFRFVHDFNIIGPFDCPKASGLETVLPPENEINFSKEYRGVAGVKVVWQKWKEENGAYVDFTKAFEPDSIGVAYGLCYIYAPREFSTQLGIGSNDGVRVFLNDKLIHDNKVLRKATPNTDMIDVTLREGWNKVLIKVDQIGGNWGMYFSVADAEKLLSFSTDKPS
ncbi:MAG: DUF4838 domain-containing protein [Calditrichaeota bacterium]|nr:DUF4838 domain-containing protein [Calditrichota bacterium]